MKIKSALERLDYDNLFITAIAFMVMGAYSLFIMLVNPNLSLFLVYLFNFIALICVFLIILKAVGLCYIEYKNSKKGDM